MEAIAQRDILKLRRELLKPWQTVPYHTGPVHPGRAKVCANGGVAELRKEVDRLSKAYRELDTAIQAVNWTVEMAITLS